MVMMMICHGDGHGNLRAIRLVLCYDHGDGGGGDDDDDGDDDGDNDDADDDDDDDDDDDSVAVLCTLVAQTRINTCLTW